MLFHVDWYDQFREMKLKRGDGNGWVRAGMVKMLVDGSMGGHTAVLREPYADMPSSRGIYSYPEEEFFSLVERVHRDGHQIGCHAMGGGAVKLLLDAIERANARSPREDHRHRAVNFRFITDKVRHLYSPDNGRPSLDSAVLFKMLFIGYVFGIRSERRLVQETQGSDGGDPGDQGEHDGP